MADETVRGFVPIPDPTVLTTEQSNRLREEMRREISHVMELADEKLFTVNLRISEIEKRAKDLDEARALALAAALQAAKEAVGEQNRSNTTAIGKSEAATEKSIQELRDTFNAAIGATNGKIDDITSRLDRGEGGHTGAADTRAWIFAAIMAAAAIAGPLVTVAAMRGHQ